MVNTFKEWTFQKFLFVFIILFITFFMVIGFADARITSQRIEVQNVTHEGFDIIFNVSNVDAPSEDTITVYYKISDTDSNQVATYNISINLPLADPYKTSAENSEKIELRLTGSGPYSAVSDSIQIRGLNPSSNYSISMMTDDGTEGSSFSRYNFTRQKTGDKPMSSAVEAAVRACYLADTGNVMGEITVDKLKEIKALNLSNIPIDDPYELIFLYNMTAGSNLNLVYLDLSGTGITDLPFGILEESNTKLETIFLPQTLKTGYIYGSFKELEIPNGAEILYIKGNFTEIEIPDSVHTLGINSSSLEHINVANVTDLRFIYAPNLTSIVLPTILTETYASQAGSPTQRGGTFERLDNITYFEIPSTIQKIGAASLPRNAEIHLPDQFIINTNPGSSPISTTGTGKLYIQNADHLVFYTTSTSIYLNKSMTVSSDPFSDQARGPIVYSGRTSPSSSPDYSDPSFYAFFNASAVPGITVNNNYADGLDSRPYYTRYNVDFVPFEVNGIHIPYGESFYFGSFDDLEDLIEMADAKVQSDYTTANWNNLQTVIGDAKSVLSQKDTLNDNNVTLFRTYGDLDMAVRSEIASSAYKDKLYDLAEKADGYEKSEYSAEIWESFENAKSNADDALKSGATTYEVDKAYERLKNIMDMMIKKSEIIDILYVGWMERPALKLAAESMYHKGYINYNYVAGFDDTWNQKNDDLAAIDYTEYDIVVLDMIGVNDIFEPKLADAASKGTSIIAVNCGYNEPDYFTAIFPENDLKFYKQTSDSQTNTNDQIVSATRWGEKFLMNLAADFTNTTDDEDLENTVEMLRSQKFEAVYIGPEGPNGADGFRSAASRQAENIYGDVGFWSAFEKDDPTKIDELKSFLNDRAGSREPMVILCDSFTDEDWTRLNGEVDLKALAESGTVVLSIRHESVVPDYVTKDLSLILTSFGYTPKEVNEASFMLFRILNQHGTDQPKAWKYIIPPSGRPSIGLYNIDVYGNRIYFDNVKDYLAWYANDGSYRHQYNPNNYTVGIWCHTADTAVGNATDDLIKRLEEHGINVIMGYDTFDNLLGYYCDENGKPLIDVGISVKNFGLNYWDHDEGIRQLEEMNVPIIKGIFPYRVSSSISDANNGIDSGIVGRSVLSSNRDGLFEFIVLGYNQSRESEIFEHQVDWTAEIIEGWGNLNRTANADKNVALIYYNYPPGKADIGANYLNVMRSFAGDGGSYDGILRTLQSNGYDVDFSNLPVATMGSGGKYTYTYGQSADVVMTEQNLMHLMYSQGINVGSHAPGVLDAMVQEKIRFEEQYGADDWWGCQLIPLDTYRQWLEEDIKSDVLKNELYSVWGKPWEDDIDPDQSGMIWTDEYDRQFLVIPAVRMGNIWIMPQPDRALAGDKGVSSADYHGDLPPTHQYIAFYLWLNRGLAEEGQTFKPDAAIHFGTHGTHEWLPGTAIGLDRHKDWAPSLIQGLPNIYPYIMANVGEGLTAEFRGNALIIDHMTPAMIRSGLYGDLLKIDTARQGYMKQISLGESENSDGAIGELVKSYRREIVNGIFDTDSVDAMNLMEYKLQINPTNPEKVTNEQLKDHLLKLSEPDFRAFVDNKVHTYIETVLENSVPYGMHVYGKSPDSQQSAAMIRAMWGNYGFEKVIETAYFAESDGTSYGIPQTPMGSAHFNNKCDADVFNFVEDIIRSDKSTAAIQQALINNFGHADPNVVYFLKGPVMYAEYELAVYQASGRTAADLEALNNNVYDQWMAAGLLDIIKEVYETTSDEQAAAGRDTKVTEAKNREFVNLTIDDMRKGVPAEKAIDTALTKQYSVNSYKSQWWINEPVVNFLTSNKILTFLVNLENSGPREMSSLLNALDAGYIPPTSGNDPVQNPDALPTGANFYGIDPSTFPTHAGWDVGQAMGEQLLADYYLKHGEFPDTISFTRFGVEFIRDEGALEACIFYLLGTYPTWLGDEYGTGAGKPFKGVEVMSPDDPRMQIKIVDAAGKVVYEGPRPRVDIVYTTAGMRDGYSRILRAVQDAVDMVYELGDQKDAKGKTIKNYVTSNTNSIAKLLEDEGMSAEEAKRIAKYRTFGQELGTYEIGTGNMISSGNGYDSETDIADLYLNKMGYIYNADSWGEKMSNSLLKILLGRTDASVFASSSNLYDNLDNDDVFQYFGAMNMVSSMYDDSGKLLDKSQWKLPEMYIADTSNVENFDPNNPGKVISTMRESLKKDMDSRYLNPEWVRGQMESGYSGSTLFAEFVENMHGWSVISNGDLITFEDWQKVYDIYVDNKYNTPEYGNLDLSSYFDEYSYAYQSITGRMIETIRQELIHTDNSALTQEQIKEREERLKEMQSQLITEYVLSVINTGVACCHHTCGNPSLDKFIAGQMSVLGLTPEEEEKYWQIVQDATDREKPEITSPPSDPSSSNRGSGYGTAVLVDAGQTAPTGEQGEQNEQSNENQDAGQSAGVGMNTGVEPGTPVSGFEMRVSQMTSSVRDFFANPSFSSSSIIAIAFVVIVVGAVFYGLRRKGL